MLTSGLIADARDERERVPDATAEVGGRRDPLERRDLLPRHDRALQPQPGARRARDTEATAHEPDVVRGPVADVLPVEELHRRWCAGGNGRRRGNRGRDRVGDVDLLGTQPQRGRRARPRHHRRGASPSSHCTFRPGRIVRTTACSARDRDRSQQFDREPRDERRGSGIVARAARARAARSARHRAVRSETRARGRVVSPRTVHRRERTARRTRRSGRWARRIVGRGARCAAMPRSRRALLVDTRPSAAYGRSSCPKMPCSREGSH